MAVFSNLIRKRSQQFKSRETRLLGFESLESRMMLAGDTFDAFIDGADVTSSSDWSTLGASSSGISAVTTPAAAGLALNFATDQVTVLKYSGFTKGANDSFTFSYDFKSGFSSGSDDKGGVILSYDSGTDNYVALVANRSGDVAVRTGKGTGSFFSSTDSLVANYGSLPIDDTTFATISGSWDDATGKLTVSAVGETHSINLGSGALPGMAVGAINRWSNVALDNIDFSLGNPVVEDADFDGDGDVDGADFLAWQRGSGIDVESGNVAPKTSGNANRDQYVNGEDLAIWQNQYDASLGQSPDVDAGPDRQLTLPTNQLTLDGSASDSDGTIAAYTWTQLSGPNTATLSGEDTEDLLASGLVEGIYEFQLEVTDNDGLTSTDKAFVTINPAQNAVPTADAGPDRQLTLPTNQITLDGSGTDTDGTINAYVWTQLSGPNTATLTNANSEDLTASGLVAGAYEFQLEVTDNASDTDTDTVNVTVSQAPTGNVAEDFQGFTDGALLQSGNWTKLGGEDVHVTSGEGTAPGSSGGTDLHPEFGGFSAAYKYDGFTYTAVDDLEFSFDINPGSSNQPGDTPIFMLSIDGSNSFIGLGINDVSDTIYTVTGNAVNLFGGLTTVPVLTGFNPQTPWQTVSGSWNASAGELSVTWKDANENSESTTVSLGVGALAGPNVGIGGKYSTTTYFDNISINLATIGAPPVVNAGPDRQINLPTTSLTLDGSATDADGTIVTYAWTQLSGPNTAMLSGASTEDLQASGLALGTYEFQLKVADNDGNARTDTTFVTVNPDPTIPVANAGTDRRIQLPEMQLTLDGSGTDGDGTIISYAWTQLSGPNTATLSGSNTEDLTASGLAEGVYEFQLKVTDNDGKMATDTAKVTVLAEAGDIVLFPAPGVAASDQYAVQVLIDGQWVDSYVNFDHARTQGSGSSDEPGKTFSWTTFQTAGPVQVRVKRLEGGFNTAVVRPTSDGITTTKIGNDTVEFTLLPGQKVSVEFDTEIHNNAYTGPPYGLSIIKDAMMVFADPLETTSALDGIPESDIYRVSPGSHETIMNVSGGSGLSAGKSTLGDANGKKVVVFEPGVYDIGYWQVPNNIDQIHIEGGAVVFGALDVIPQGRSPFYDAATINQVYRDGWQNETLRTSFALTGSGIISGAKLPWHLKKDFTYTSNDDWWAHVKVVQLAVENITLEDVTIADSPHWVLTFINDDDARTKGTFDNFKMVAAWTYNNDGLPNPTGAGSSITNAFIHADDDALKIYNSDSTVDNIVIWQSNNGAAFQFGWFPKTVHDVGISNIDVIHFENWYGVNQPNRALFNYANAGGPGTIQDISFTNVNVEGTILRLFGFNTVGSPQVIKDITFTNLNVPDGIGVGNLGDPGANYFLGNISNFHFENFVYAGSVVTTAAQADFDFANGAGSGFTFSSAPLSNLFGTSPFNATLAFETDKSSELGSQERIDTQSREEEGQTINRTSGLASSLLLADDNKRAISTTLLDAAETKELPDIDLLLRADPDAKFDYRSF